jgi:hypothetical protein
MVGGFSESPYIYEKIKVFAEGNGLQVIRPAYASVIPSASQAIQLTHHSWSAVVRGAAAKGLEGDGRAPIKNRKCRRYYGTDFVATFVLGKHREADASICSYTGLKQANNQMEWLLKKGQDLSTKNDSHAKVSFCQFFWPNDKRVAHMDLLACDGEKGPVRSLDKVSFA